MQRFHKGILRRRATLPTRAEAVGFWLRSRVLIGLRVVRNLRQPQLRRWPTNEALAEAPIRAQLRLPLWTDGRDDEFALVAGKVHNLRIATRAFDGVVVPAGERLSFWRQLGPPTARRGFVRGREVRAGCVVPAIAGGICQISNALATCAVRAGFELDERHAHTARIEQAAQQDDQLDATVFWNYVDLQIRAAVDWRLELALDASHMVLTIRSRDVAVALPSLRSRPVTVAPREPSGVAAPVARGCLSCNEVTCFRHEPRLLAQQARSAWLLDGCQPEFLAWLRTQPVGADRLLPWPLRRWWPARTTTAAWAALPVPAEARTERFGWVSLRRAWWLRRHARDAGKRQGSVLDGQRWLAGAYARRLQPEQTHLVIDQGLLPHLQQHGVLGGRSYDVLAAALPMSEIQHRLDLASQRPSIANGSLTDFRAAPTLMQAEHLAMRGARRIVTAHAEVARYWRQQGGVEVVQLPWQLPTSSVPRVPRGADASPLVVLPASALARKGVHELAEALQGMRCRLRVLGTAAADVTVWRGLSVEQGRYADDWLACADAVVLPAHVEHAPRALLMALAAGIPVIATAACGVQGMPGVVDVPAGDALALAQALSRVLANPMAVDRVQDGTGTEQSPVSPTSAGMSSYL